MTRFSDVDSADWVARSPHTANGPDTPTNAPCRYPPPVTQRDPAKVAVTDGGTRDRHSDHPDCHAHARCLERCWQTGNQTNQRCLVACWQTEID